MYPTIISAEWLSENLYNRCIKVFDVTFFENETVDRARHIFAKAHIAGSYQLLMRGKDFSGKYYQKIPKASTFGELAREAGFSSKLHAVFYDRDGRSAIRVWWLFQFFGHPKVSILQGGMTRWSRLGFEMELKKNVKPVIEDATFGGIPRMQLVTEPPEIVHFIQETQQLPREQKEYLISNFQAYQPLNLNGILNLGSQWAPDIKFEQPIRQNFRQVIDCRALSPEMRPIPGAVHISYLTFYNDAGELDLDVVKISQVFAQKKLYVDQVIAICGETGFDSAVMTLICFLFSGHGIFGTQLLVNGKVSDFWVGVFEKEEDIKQKIKRSYSKLASIRAGSASFLSESLTSLTQLTAHVEDSPSLAPQSSQPKPKQPFQFNLAEHIEVAHESEDVDDTSTSDSKPRIGRLASLSQLKPLDGFAPEADLSAINALQ